MKSLIPRGWPCMCICSPIYRYDSFSPHLLSFLSFLSFVFCLFWILFLVFIHHLLSIYCRFIVHRLSLSIDVNILLFICIILYHYPYSLSIHYLFFVHLLFHVHWSYSVIVHLLLFNHNSSSFFLVYLLGYLFILFYFITLSVY